jgi:hypothetical protein
MIWTVIILSFIDHGLSLSPFISQLIANSPPSATNHGKQENQSQQDCREAGQRCQKCHATAFETKSCSPSLDNVTASSQLKCSSVWRSSPTNG